MSKTLLAAAAVLLLGVLPASAEYCYPAVTGKAKARYKQASMQAAYREAILAWDVAAERTRETGPAHAEQEMDSMQVLQAMSSLSPERRAVLADVYIHGSSVGEASEKLGIPPDTVKSRRYNALQSLRKLLGERERADGLVAHTT